MLKVMLRAWTRSLLPHPPVNRYERISQLLLLTLALVTLLLGLLFLLTSVARAPEEGSRELSAGLFLCFKACVLAYAPRWNRINSPWFRPAVPMSSPSYVVGIAMYIALNIVALLCLLLGFLDLMGVIDSPTR